MRATLRIRESLTLGRTVVYTSGCLSLLGRTVVYTSGCVPGMLGVCIGGVQGMLGVYIGWYGRVVHTRVGSLPGTLGGVYLPTMPPCMPWVYTSLYIPPCTLPGTPRWSHRTSRTSACGVTLPDDGALGSNLGIMLGREASRPSWP